LFVIVSSGSNYMIFLLTFQTRYMHKRPFNSNII
jgi:hypothetical protein